MLVRFRTYRGMVEFVVDRNDASLPQLVDHDALVEGQQSAEVLRRRFKVARRAWSGRRGTHRSKEALGGDDPQGFSLEQLQNRIVQIGGEDDCSHARIKSQ